MCVYTLGGHAICESIKNKQVPKRQRDKGPICLKEVLYPWGYERYKESSQLSGRAIGENIQL